MSNGTGTGFSAAQNHTGKQVATARDVDGIINELGDEEAFRRMYSAAQLDRPTGTVEVNGQEKPPLCKGWL